MPPHRLLFVDDEPSIRATLPPILAQNGFEVRAAATVREALAEINVNAFDVLISDLNIGEPGDGFTVVSAMRRSQPSCVNFILTGYPAFESALRAIQAHVDDYLVKPTDLETLVAKIHERLNSRPAVRQVPRKRIAALLRENLEEIKLRVLTAMKADSELNRLPLSDEERVDDLPAMVVELANLLESPALDSQRIGVSTISASQHGRTRRQQRYSVTMLFEDARLVQKAIFQIVQEHILEVELSQLVSDLSLVTETLQLELCESSQAFLSAEADAA
jgi:YesN/AraC family two-component response regulator